MLLQKLPDQNDFTRNHFSRNYSQYLCTKRLYQKVYLLNKLLLNESSVDICGKKSLSSSALKFI